MRVRLDYDCHGLEVELPERHVVKCLQYQPAQPLTDPAATVATCLARPLGTPSLRELAAGRRNACVVVSDITRPVPNKIILPPVLAILEESGVPRDRILILIATGMHRPNLGAELVELVGPFVAENYRIANHNGRALAEHTYLGDSPRGVPIWIDSRYLNSDLKITTGLIEPHFMAGYSGGRKVICPGLVARETVKVWHSPRFLEHPNARSGCLQGNPVHEENTIIARRAGCDFILNTVLDARRQIVAVVAGDMEAAFQAGAQVAAKVAADTIAEPVDIVVTSSAGYPLDTTYYQSVKGMVAALPIIKPGGTIILAAGMRQGIGSSEFQELFEEHATLEAFMERILSGDYFKLDQWQLEEFAKVRRQARVVVVTNGLSPAMLRRLFVETAPSVEAAVAESLTRYGDRATIAVIPKGPYVLAELAENAHNGKP